MRAPAALPGALRPLVLACLAAVVADAGAASFSAPMPQGWRPDGASGIAALFGRLQEKTAARPASAPHIATTLAVTSCADNGAIGTLRSVVESAGQGDTIDLSALACSSITLAQGAIPVKVDDLLLSGPGAEAFAIDAAGLDRAFVHYGYGTFALQGLTVRNGVTRVTGYHVTGGACVISNGYVTLDHSHVSGCLSEGEGAYGGGITARGVALYSSRLSGNTALGSHPATFTAAYGGGAMAYRGQAYIVDSTISGNRAKFHAGDTHGSYDTGGGVFSDRGGFARGSTFSDNFSYGTGGALATHGAFDIEQSTFSGNIAKGKGGGAVFARLFEPMQVANSTLAGNLAARGGGIYTSGLADMLSLQSSIVAGNHAALGSDIAAAAASHVGGAHNLVLGTDTNSILPIDTLGVEPRLGPLADNGGATFTRALLPDSPALDAGDNPNGYANDQRGGGFPRVLGSRADIGAVEGALALAAPQPAPALQAWIAALLASLLGGAGAHALRRRRASRIFAD